MPVVTTKMRARWVDPHDSQEHLFDIEEVQKIRPPHHINAGDLRDRVELQSLTETRSAHGGITKTFATTDTVWGLVKFITGRESFAADQVQAEANVEITIRDQILFCRERHSDGWRG